MCKSLLKTTENTRELGGYHTSSALMTRKGVLLRSDAVCNLSEEDMDWLRERKITTIIDMRTVEDVTQKPDGLGDSSGFTYINIPIIEGSGIPESADEVPKSYLKISKTPELANVFKSIAASSNGVLFHCTAGKDRSGVVSAILLLHAGVEDEDIIANYVISRVYLADRFRRIHSNFPEIDMEIITPKEAYMESFLNLFRESFGNTEQYFQTMGLSRVEIAGLRRKLLG